MFAGRNRPSTASHHIRGAMAELRSLTQANQATKARQLGAGPVGRAQQGAAFRHHAAMRPSGAAERSSSSSSSDADGGTAPRWLGGRLSSAPSLGAPRRNLGQVGKAKASMNDGATGLRHHYIITRTATLPSNTQT
jgi:hypothetical protein